MSGKGIRIEGLKKRYGKGDTAVDALKGVNMQVAPGEVVGLVGPSGSGKTTLLKCLGAVIISPLLSNIYLHELDRYMEQMQMDFRTGKGRKKNKAYTKFAWKVESLRKNYREIRDHQADQTALAMIRKDIKLLKIKMGELKARDPMDQEYKRLWYCRYADDCVPRRHVPIRYMSCCTKDEGRPLGIAIQVEIPNHRELRRSRAGVVSVTEKAGGNPVRYVSGRRT